MPATRYPVLYFDGLVYVPTGPPFAYSSHFAKGFIPHIYIARKLGRLSSVSDYGPKIFNLADIKLAADCKTTKFLIPTKSFGCTVLTMMISFSSMQLK